MCSRSNFFTGVVESGFFESQTRTLDLPEGDPYLIKKVIQYLYTPDYSSENYDTEGMLQMSPAKIDARIYGLEDQFGIDSLKAVATNRFYTNMV